MKDFLISVWRSAVRERRYVAINLGGLALGFACCLILALFLYSELTYDRHFEAHPRIHRMLMDTTFSGQLTRGAWVPRAAAPLFAADHPEIEAYVRFTDSSLQDGLRLRHEDLVLNWQDTYFADDSVFRVFSHQVLAGDPDTALVPESTVAVSARLAKAYFGDANPIGQLLYTDAGEPWKITLVFADLPSNTHLRYDALFAGKIPLLRDATSVAGLREQITRGFGAYTYLLMRPGFDPAEWERINADFLKRYIDGTLPPNVTVRSSLQPLTAIHYGEPVSGDQPTGNTAYLYGCLAVALLILAVACINYTNLATARALRRARSVAIRKILGARRSRLLLECLGEAVLYALVAALIGLALAEVAVTFTPIGELLGQQVRFDLSSNAGLLGSVFGAAVLIGLIAGIWPAVYLSAWMPAAAFSTRGGGAASGAKLRETLVLLQFVMAVAVVASTLVMAAQMRYVATAPLGFERENRVMVTLRGTEKFPRVPVLAQQLQRHPEVLGVTQATMPPGRINPGNLSLENAQGERVNVRGAAIEVGAEFIQQMSIPLVAGRGFSAQAPPAREFIVNETLVRQMGWPDAIGRQVFDGRVIGVVRDFHFSSLREPITPFVLGMVNDDPSSVPEAQRPFWQRRLMIRISGRDFPGTIEHIEAVMREFDPANPFEYRLLDEDLRTVYTTERRMLALIAVFASLCIFIACLGLFGLTAFATERRAREIAIRKVLGASSWQVVMLLAQRILILIGIGGAIAAVAAWQVMDEWLSGFAYRVNVSPLLLLLSVVVAAAVALLTVLLQSLRTARADPADALRGE